MTSTEALHFWQKSQSLEYSEVCGGHYDVGRNKKEKKPLHTECVHCLQAADKEPLWTVWVIPCKQCGFFLPFQHPTLLKLAVGWQAAQICFFTSCFQVGIALTGCIHLCCTGTWSCVGLLLMSYSGLRNWTSHLSSVPNPIQVKPLLII